MAKIESSINAIRYEGNNVHYYPYFDLCPTGNEPNVEEQDQVLICIYDGGNLSDIN